MKKVETPTNPETYFISFQIQHSQTSLYLEVNPENGLIGLTSDARRNSSKSIHIIFLIIPYKQSEHRGSKCWSGKTFKANLKTKVLSQAIDHSLVDPLS